MTLTANSPDPAAGSEQNSLSVNQILGTTIAIAVADGITTFTIIGDFDAYTAPKVRDAFVAANARGEHWIVVDLAGVTCVDSTGLGVLVGELKRCREHGGQLAIAVDLASDASAAKALRVTGLSKAIEVFATAAAAVEFLVAQRTAQSSGAPADAVVATGADVPPDSADVLRRPMGEHDAIVPLIRAADMLGDYQPDNAADLARFLDSLSRATGHLVDGFTIAADTIKDIPGVPEAAAEAIATNLHAMSESINSATWCVQRAADTALATAGSAA